MQGTCTAHWHVLCSLVISNKLAGVMNEAPGRLVADDVPVWCTVRVVFVHTLRNMAPKLLLKGGRLQSSQVKRPVL